MAEDKGKKKKRPKTSAGLLLFRRSAGLEVLIAHMGGPFWEGKDEGAWSIPKGEYEVGVEDPELAARREFLEETGIAAPDDPGFSLGEIVQKSGKRVVAWAIEGDLDPAECHSSTFTMEWPPKSGKVGEFPEIDRVEWVGPEQARKVLIKGQAGLIDRLERHLAGEGTS